VKKGNRWVYKFGHVKMYSGHLMLFLCVPAGTLERFYIMTYESYLSNSKKNSQRWDRTPLSEYKDPEFAITVDHWSTPHIREEFSGDVLTGGIVGERTEEILAMCLDNMIFEKTSTPMVCKRWNELYGMKFQHPNKEFEKYDIVGTLENVEKRFQFKSKSDLSNGVGVQLYRSAGRDASKRYPYGNTDFDILVLVFGKKNVEQTGDDLVDTCKNVQ